jgi:hypothetical protein
VRVELAAQLGRPVRETGFVDVRIRHREPMLRRREREYNYQIVPEVLGNAYYSRAS